MLAIDSANTRLNFGGASLPEGFASKAVASDNDANASVIVRELIQNCLDAGTDAGVERVEVDFEISDLKLDDIPGIEAYKRAFNAAREQQAGQVQDAAAVQIERIEKRLLAPSVAVLNVRDNGIGLDMERTNALLSDGLSNKTGADSGSAGSYGVGHYTTFPASDLRYVLYGGVTKCGTQTMSGHAILASHKDDKGDLRSKDGLYIVMDRGTSRDLYNMYKFPQDRLVPPSVKKTLTEIREQHNHGSVVMILGFNNFLDDEDPEEAILRVASRHFYPVIRREFLVIRVRNGDKEAITLDRDKASQFLKKGQHEKRSVSREAINGNKAYAIWQTFERGNEKTLSTEFGKISLHFREADANERTRISLYRNGMFITDQIPKMAIAQFAQYRRFNAVILIDAERGNASRAFNLIRRAEGEKHSDLSGKRLKDSEAQEFEGLLKKIRDEIKNNATKDDGDSFRAQGFMELESLDSTERMSRPRTPSNEEPKKSKKFETIREGLETFPDKGDGGRPTPNPDPNPDPNPKPKPQARTSSNADERAPVKLAARRRGNEVRIIVRPEDDVPNAIIRLFADQGSDVSCRTPLKDLPLKLRALGSQADYHAELNAGTMQQGQHFDFGVELEDGVPGEAVIKVDVASRKEAVQDAS